MTFFDVRQWLYWGVLLYMTVFLLWHMYSEKDIKQQVVAGFAAIAWILRLLSIK